MKIDNSGLTYSRIPNSQTIQPRPQPMQDQSGVNPSRGIPNVEPTDSVSRNQGAAQSQFSPPVSKYLSTEERQMLSRLFPPAQGGPSVHTYNQSRQAVHQPVNLGQKLDVTT